ncbi:MAG: 5-formyltetrahydrofolate cyclo-ligase [Bacteroidales bacterium]|nr:5-formyltetrahydrofolate cyclo-ligase [Bacteroidales bacterium]
MILEKKTLRKKIRELKTSFSVSELKNFSSFVTDKIKSEAFWQKASTVLLYYPLKDELDVTPLIKDAALNNKTVLLPVVENEILKLGVYKNDTLLIEGAFGILEPSTELFPEEKYSEIDVAVIPGVAFDKNGNRLGRGKGYYDRFLPELTSAYIIGVCFPFQMFEEIPSEEFDVRMDKVFC